MRRIAVTAAVMLGLVAPVAVDAHRRHHRHPHRRPGTVQLNEHSAGRTIAVRVGDRVAVRLGGATTGGYDPPAITGDALVLISSSGGYPTGQPARALFAARRRGSATITAETDYPCLHATPRCLIAQRVWIVHVRVVR